MSEDTVLAAERERQASSNGVLRGRIVRHWICILSLILADVAAFAVSALLFRSGHEVPRLLIYNGAFPFGGTVDLFYILGGLFIIVRYIAGDYSRRQLFWDDARLTTMGLLIASALCVFLLGLPSVNYSPFAVLGSWTFVIVAVPLFRQLARQLLSFASIWQMPTALIGEASNISEAYGAFRQSLCLGFDVRFLITMDASDEHIKEIPGVTCIGLREPANIVRRLGDAGCLEAVVATNRIQDLEADGLIQRLLAADIGVAVIPPLRRLPLLGITTNYFFGRDILLLHVRNNLSRRPTRIVKRLFDIAGSVVLLAILWPVFAVIAYLIYRDDGGPIFFIQNRVGLDGREFGCFKFRSMKNAAEELLNRWKQEGSPLYAEYIGSNFKLRNDPRTTAIGRWLRRKSLDELPQLLNVLSGDMSLVGPRPVLSREIGEYGEPYILYKQVRPGMTGLWQISGRSHTDFADRVASDEWYIKNWSMWHDIVILIKTVAVLLQRDGAY